MINQYSGNLDFYNLDSNYDLVKLSVTFLLTHCARLSVLENHL